MDVYAIVKKLIGDIEPVGETNTDKKRFTNLEATTKLVDALLTDIDNVAYEYKDRHEHSVKKAAQFAGEFLTKIGIEE